MDERDPQTYAVIGAAMEVHRQLGNGFLEAVYQEALALELTARCIPHEREWPIPIEYKGTTLDCTYRADFVCFESVLVELKAVSVVGRIEHAQVINYLKATGLKRGLLINFAGPSLQYKRLVL